MQKYIDDLCICSMNIAINQFICIINIYSYTHSRHSNAHKKSDKFVLKLWFLKCKFFSWAFISFYFFSGVEKLFLVNWIGFSKCASKQKKIFYIQIEFIALFFRHVALLFMFYFTIFCYFQNEGLSWLNLSRSWLNVFELHLQ